MKLKKKSGLIGAIVALSCASMISVGFASWVISQGDDQTVNGTILVDTVETKDYKITNLTKVTGDALDDKIIFGVDTSSWSGSPWLTNTGTIGTSSQTSVANLTASFSFKISNVEAASVSGNVATLTGTGYKLTATFANVGYDDALTDGLTYTDSSSVDHNYKNLVGALPTPTLSFDDDTDVFTWSVTFTWGSDFGNKNPYQYFNEKENTLANAQEAEYKLGALEKLAASYSINLVIAANAA